jgi:DNA invertase Pin-like site-specific DNA recombinase
MKAIIYARYSSDNQREESIDGQLRECKAFADKNKEISERRGGCFKRRGVRA